MAWDIGAAVLPCIPASYVTKISKYAKMNIPATLINAGNKIKLIELYIDSSKLQKKWKHAVDFGIKGNYNKNNAKLFEKTIRQYVTSADIVYKSFYRGQEVYLFVKNGIGVYTDLYGNFISGWKLTKEQLEFHL